VPEVLTHSMRTPRQTDLRRALLTVLANVPSGYLLPTPLVQSGAARVVIPEPTTTEFEGELRAADSARLIVGVVGEDATRWKLTDAGRAWLAEHP